MKQDDQIDYVLGPSVLQRVTQDISMVRASAEYEDEWIKAPEGLRRHFEERCHPDFLPVLKMLWADTKAEDD